MNTAKSKGDILADEIERALQGGLEVPLREIIKKALSEYRKPWTLGRSVNGFTLSEGQEWHRQDWTQDMLPDGTRPLLLDERREFDDEIYGLFGGGPWTRYPQIKTALEFAEDGAIHSRTRRPLPAVVDPYAALKSAHEEGKVIEWRFKNGSQWVEKTVNFDLYLDECEYRIKPAPVMVPLGPEDVTPGSVIRIIGMSSWGMVGGAGEKGIHVGTEPYTYEQMKEQLEISRDGGKTWEKCEKESK